MANDSTAVDLHPKCYLFNWLGILSALNLPNNKESRKRVRDLNTKFQGPIVLPGKGGQPKVCKERLLEWWDGLEKQFVKLQQKQVDREATLSASYSHGKEATVLPDIAGHVVKRRQT